MGEKMERAEIQVQQKQIEALVAKAEQEGSIDSLREALHLCLLLAPEITQYEDPLAWAEHKVGTAKVAEMLGRQTQQRRYLDLAQGEYEAALTVFSVKDQPEKWERIRFELSYLLLQQTMIFQQAEDADNAVSFARETISLQPGIGAEAYLALSSALSSRYSLSGSAIDAKAAAEALNHVADEEENFPFFLFKATTWLQAAKAVRSLESAEKSLHYAVRAQDAMSRGESPMPLMAQPAIDQAKSLIEELKGRQI